MSVHYCHETMNTLCANICLQVPHTYTYRWTINLKAVEDNLR